MAPSPRELLASKNNTLRLGRSFTSSQWKLILSLIVGLCVVRLWLMPLGSSFWVDEMGTAFVVEHGAQDPSLAVAPQVPASIFYAVAKTSKNVFGSSEVAFRLPSFLAMMGALWFITRIAGRLIHPGAAWFAAFACFTLRDLNYEAADARPYALATLTAAASFWFLIRWLDSNDWLDALLFAGCASVLWRVHLILWPVYVAFAFYTLVRLLRRDTAVSWARIAAVYGALGVSLIPVLLQAMQLNRQAAAHVVVKLPTTADLVNAAKPGIVLAFCAATALLGRWFRWPAVPPIAKGESLCLIFGWWLSAPLCLYAFSILTGNSVFVSRYYSIALPGLALASTVAAAAFVPSRYWKALSATLGIGVLLLLGRWGHVWLPHHNSDWRTAAQHLNQYIGPETPIICPSPFIEARPPVWRPDYPISSFLYSHLLVYRLKGKAIPFPFETSPEAEQFAARLSTGVLAGTSKFAVYGGDRSAFFWREWFSARPELAGWRIRRLGPFGDVEAFVFERDAPRAAKRAGVDQPEKTMSFASPPVLAQASR
jgi:mannosyltransferase